MGNEQAKTIEALKLAIQMEVEGKKFYQQANQKGSNKPEANKARFLGKSGSIKPWLPRSEGTTLPCSTPMNT